MLSIYLFNFRLLLLKDKRITRHYGYSPLGTRASVQNRCYSTWGPHYNAVSAISCDGVVALYLLGEGQPFNTGTFSDFLQNHLLPSMNTFNGRNLRSVLVMGKLNITEYMHCKAQSENP